MGKKNKKEVAKPSREFNIPPNPTPEDYQHIVEELETYRAELEAQNEELRSSQQRLEESRLQYSDLYDFSPVGYFSFDSAGRIIHINFTGAGQLGADRNLLIGKKIQPFVIPKDRDRFQDHLQTVYKTQGRHECEVRIRKWTSSKPEAKEGKSFYARLESIFVKNACRTAISDITLRKQAEDALRDSEQNLAAELAVRKKAEEALRQNDRRFREMIESLPAAVYTTDAEGHLTHFNSTAVKYAGREPELGTDQWCVSWKLYRPDGTPLPHDECPMAVALKEGRAVRGEEVIIERPDGTRAWVLPYPTPIFDSQGKVVGGVNMVLDITDRKRMEAELAKSSKLESIGILAGGIAHDFNNLLTAILANISLSKLSLDPESKISSRLGEAQKVCLHAQSLTRQLLTFSRGGDPIMKTFAIGDFLGEWVAFSLRGSNIRASVEVQPGLWPVEADEGQLNQVINNLVINAQQSMPKGGLVTLKAENLRLGPEHRLPLPDGRYIKLSIADQGVGIHKKLLSKIFDPFFTTKTTGSGLGLTISHAIVSKHKGHLAVESEPDRGTTVSVYLPASMKTIAARKREEKVILKGEGRVLLMDDEEAVRNSIGQLIEAAGYRVEAVGDGAEAIARYRQALESGKRFDVVILDLTVRTGMGGKEAMAKLLEIDPKVRAIVSTGYSNDPVLANFKEYGFIEGLEKPYTLEKLSLVLKKCLEEK